MASGLSVLVPVRTDDFAFYRKRLALRAALDLNQVETVIIDDGSPPAVAAEIADFCAAQSFEYLRMETADRPFSLARSRNAGVQAARSSWVYMDDADLVYRRDFFQEVIAQLKLLYQTPFNFVSIPAVYLTADASTQVFKDGCLDPSYRQVVHALLLENPKGSSKNRVVESYAPASGVVALSKGLALQVGGYDESFSGWGGEDRDFIFRLLCANEKIGLPENFNETRSWNLNDTLAFDGWRSLHRLHGEFMARQDMYAVHLHHKRQAWRTEISSAKNMRLADGKALSVKMTDLPMRERFDWMQSVLFDSYRLHGVLRKKNKKNASSASVNDVGRLRDAASGKEYSLRKKMRKFLISPAGFLRDSRYAALRVLARFVSK